MHVPLDTMIAFPPVTNSYSPRHHPLEQYTQQYLNGRNIFKHHVDQHLLQVLDYSTTNMVQNLNSRHFPFLYWPSINAGSHSFTILFFFPSASMALDLNKAPPDDEEVLPDLNQAVDDEEVLPYLNPAVHDEEVLPDLDQPLHDEELLEQHHILDGAEFPGEQQQHISPLMHMSIEFVKMGKRHYLP